MTAHSSSDKSKRAITDSLSGIPESRFAHTNQSDKLGTDPNRKLNFESFQRAKIKSNDESISGVVARQRS
jgi:hypothetical protein